uniref:non-specific serine/threonine protein kinase n=1 Tax=Tanacetum cinerariifolium TaxID=118510 RepID=A0A699H6I4_TANCI|nr:probable serine/threonine-protein kinase Cdc7 [Tanacetum cinerariifolium]
MENHHLILSNSSPKQTDLHLKSFHLFALLLSIGHPVTPLHLSSLCRAFSLDASPKFVEFACSVADSPIEMTREGLVTVSSDVFVALKRFFNNSRRNVKVLMNCEKNELRCERRCDDEDDDEMTWYRKRRRLSHNVGPLDLTMRFTIPNYSKVYIHVDDDEMLRSVFMNAGNSSNDDRPDEMTVRLPTQFTFDAGLLNYGSNIGRLEGEREMCRISRMKEIGNNSNVLSNDTHIRLPGTRATLLSGLKDCFQLESSSYLTANSNVRIEEIEGDSCMLSKKPNTRSRRALDNSKVNSVVKAWINEKCVLGLASPKGNVKNLSHNTGHGGMIHELNTGNTNTLICNDTTPCQEVGEQNIVLPTAAEEMCANEAQMGNSQEEEKACGRDEQLVCSRDPETLLMNVDMPAKNDCTSKNIVRRKQACTNIELNLKTPTTELISPDQKHVPEITAKLVATPKDATSTEQTISVTVNKGDDVGKLIEQKPCRKDKRPVSVKQRIKSTCDQKVQPTGERDNVKEKKEKAPIFSVKDHSEPKELPVFESYIVEEEEGSGGYGTVYKVRRKEDGITFAVKYPHENANRGNIYNELKMLERFGGKNFVIRYEGSFKSGNSDCLVLEHVAHDRPEVLRREIDVDQLRWYGYCLFRALASLHKQGVVHRDVKPGNFLFSCEASKGYLIDFNLATDLHQKSGSTEKSKYHDASFGSVPPPHPESLPPSKSRKYTSSKALIAGTHSKSLLSPKNLKRKTDQVKDLNMQNVMKSQGADGSGITSTKDATSKAERFRQPIPSTGRKELLNLAHKAIQSRDHEIISTPSMKRKRVAAPPTNIDNKFMYLTPMPLQSTGISVARTGAGLLKYKGEGKQRKEGSCVGTKGFRSPEVLLKSIYQGPKVDVWSAGVTLLYFIIGRSPFVGDPDQNIKEIAKLRGSEDLWEVAKLHDREASFPPELYQVQSLGFTKLEEWCKQITRRPNFIEVIPSSLIDLVDKCLMVNPRSRLSAEDALNHEFFAPCHKLIEKQKLMRQRQSMDSRIMRSV